MLVINVIALSESDRRFSFLLMLLAKENRRPGSGFHKFIIIWTGSHLVPLEKGPCNFHCRSSSLEFRWIPIIDVWLESY